MLTENAAKDMELALAACQSEKLVLECRFCPYPSKVILPPYGVSFEQFDWFPSETQPRAADQAWWMVSSMLEGLEHKPASRILRHVRHAPHNIPMSSNKRKAVACERCHAKKIKCLGG